MIILYNLKSLYVLDVIPFHSNSIKLVTQAWNCNLRWLYEVGKFTSTIYLFDSHGTIFVRFLLHCNILFLYVCMQSTGNDEIIFVLIICQKDTGFVCILRFD